jgi:hypothetical protein
VNGALAGNLTFRQAEFDKLKDEASSYLIEFIYE